MTAVSERGTQANINVTPLIDVLLVLLIIFMVITPLMPKGLSASVPQSSYSNQATPEPAIVLELQKDHRILLNNQSIQATDLGRRLKEMYSTRANRTLFLKADKNLEYREIAQVIDKAQGTDRSIQVAVMPSEH